jgi:predicted RNA-binding Zn ribbon-like protein
MVTGSPAPGDLAILQRFVNTADLEAGTDELSDPDRLAAWAREAGLAGADVRIDEADRRRVIEFREALRALLVSHHGGEPDEYTIRTLDAAAGDAHVLVSFGPDGVARLRAAGEGADAVLAGLVAIIARAEAEGTWPRLKACAADACRWAFYDRSRNRSGTWCSMSVCGNRAKARSYRARQR